MKVVCTKKNLSKGLQITSRIIGSGNTLPILNNILFKTDEGRLKLSSTNLEMAINTWVGGKIEDQGEITIPARLVNEYVNNLMAEKITITTKNQSLYIESDKAQTNIKGLSSEEFPLIPWVAEAIYAKVDALEFAYIIREVGFAAAFSETQPEISGVLFSFEDKTLTLAATDRYRLAEGKIKLAEEVNGVKQVIVPARAVVELNRILEGGIVEVYLAEGQICMKTGDTELVSRLIEGQYPDYKQIVPKGFTSEVSIDREQFIQGLKAASVLASDNNNVELLLGPQNRQLVIKSQSAQSGESEIHLDGEFIGEKNSIIFNYRYLLECLNNLPDEKVSFKVINPASPAEIVPVGRDNYLYIVMPIKM